MARARGKPVRRALRIVLKLAFALVLLVTTLLVLALFAINLEPTRSTLIAKLNAALRDSFKGRVELLSYRTLDLSGVTGAHLRIYAPDGGRVLDGTGATVRVNLPALAYAAVLGKKPFTIRIDSVALEHADIRLDQDAQGAFSLVRAFEPKTPSPKPAEPSTLRLSLVRAQARHAWVHGHLQALPTLDTELNGLRGSLAIDEKGTRLNIDELGLVARALPQHADPRGRLKAALLIPEAADRGLTARAEFDGQVARIATVARVALGEQRLDGRVVIRDASPAAIHALVPSLEPAAPVSGQVEASGTLPQISVKARLQSGAASVRVVSKLSLKPTLSGHAELTVEHVNGRKFAPSFPETEIGLSGDIWVTQTPNSGFSGRYALQSPALRLAEYRVPPLSLDGTFRDTSFTARVTARDSGLRIDLASTLLPQSPEQHVAEFSADVQVPNLQRLMLAAPAQGSADLHAKGRYDLARASLEANAQLGATDVRLSGISVRHVALGARVAGPVAGLQLQVAAKVTDANVNGQLVRRADISARGPLLAPRVALDVDGPRGVHARAAATVRPGSIAIEDLNLELTRRNAKLSARADTIHIAGPRVDFSNVHVTGVGELDATGSVSPSDVRMNARADALDLHELAELAGFEQLVQSGTVSLDVDVHGPLTALRGKVSTRIRDLSAVNLAKSSAEAELELAGQKMDGKLRAVVGHAGEVEVVAKDVRFPRGRAANVRALSGDVELTTDLDLNQLVRALPDEMRPIDHAAGRLKATIHVSRRSARETPNLTVAARTVGLELVGKGSPQPIENRAEAKRRKALTLKSVDVTLDASLDGATGETTFNARAFDQLGTLLSLSGKATVRRALLEARGPALERELVTLPLDLDLNVPRRELAKLPVTLRPAGIVGSAALDAKLAGTALDPRFTLHGEGRGLRSKDPTFPTPIDVNADVRYAAARGELAIDAYRKGKLALKARSNVVANLPELARRPLRDGDILGSAAIDLASFPLSTIPVLKERQVEGDLSGRIELNDFGRDASLRADARVDRVELGRVHRQTARLSATAGAGKMAAEFELSHGDGYMRAKLSSGLDWGQKLVPSLNDRTATRTELIAHNFRIGSVQPFVADQVSSLDGRLNADLKSASEGGATTVEGQAKLDHGVLQVPAIGQEFRDVQARVTALSGGVIKLEDAQARGRQGRVRAAAAARLEGLTLRTARARLEIAEREKLPLTTQGVELGNAWGAIDATLFTAPDRKTTTLNVRAPKFHLELPEMKQHAVQTLPDAGNIRVGVHVGPQEFHALPLQPLDEPKANTGQRLVLNVELGNDVWVRQGTTARARLAGSLRIDVTAETEITGRIRIADGKLDVSGKKFDLESGVVTFQRSDPSNPIVVATARHDSPEGYRVYADFTGPVKTGKLSLRSEPPLTEDEILNLLLFGTTDGSFGTGAGQGGTAQTAVGVGGSTATQGLNAALADITDLDVSTRIDTSRGSPTPELVIQLSRRLSAQVGYYLGTPSLGQPPDRTFVTLDFRIKRRWSLDTTVGDRGGTGVDAVWRHRY